MNGHEEFEENRDRSGAPAVSRRNLAGWAERQPSAPGLAARVDVPTGGDGEPAVVIADPGNLEARLIRHAEHLRYLLGVREISATAELQPYDDELHSAAYRLLTTIDLLTKDADDSADEAGERS
ncbi:hypothetical protein AB0I69_42480 [Streptomyces sp. NPDC050508]|uniref:hypothetical protein n=1 Tax=Streptomyces sp. NPDC050508 TaxID=3155405 RepID=UPI0034319CC5